MIIHGCQIISFPSDMPELKDESETVVHDSFVSMVRRVKLDDDKNVTYPKVDPRGPFLTIRAAIEAAKAWDEEEQKLKPVTLADLALQAHIDAMRAAAKAQLADMKAKSEPKPADPASTTEPPSGSGEVPPVVHPDTTTEPKPTGDDIKPNA